MANIQYTHVVSYHLKCVFTFRKKSRKVHISELLICKHSCCQGEVRHHEKRGTVRSEALGEVTIP